VSDLELDAMGAINGALDRLEPPAQQRVLQWAVAKFEVALALAPARAKAGGAPGEGETAEFTEVGDLMHAAQPTAGPENALVVGYWLQQIQGHDTWTGGEINSTLKNLGLPLANVTKTLDSLRKRKPALVMQVGKAGRSRQARKDYKLTTAGLAAVTQMIANAGQGDPA
jgi:hypothetical protein